MAATTEDRVRRLIAEFLFIDIGRVMHTARFTDLVADSLDIFELSMELEDEFGCVITDEEVGGINTVQDAIDAVVRGVEREGRAL